MNDDELRELAYSAHEEAMAFGLSHDTFLRYFKTIRNRCTQAEYRPNDSHDDLTPGADSTDRAGVPEGFRSVGTVNCHISGELDLAIGTELFIRAAGVPPSDGGEQ